MSGLIGGLFGLVFLGGLLMFIRGRGRTRSSADDTLITDLLGPPALGPRAREEGDPSPAARAAEKGQPPPAARAREEDKPPPAARAREEDKPPPAVRAREEDKPPPAASALPGGEDDWLETQLAWINAWSQRMNQQITPAEQPQPQGKE